MPDKHLRTDWFLRTVAVGPAFRALSRMRVEGRENVPREGAVIVAANHLSSMDAVIVPLAMDRPTTFLAKAEYFTGEGLKGRLTAGFMERLGTIPVDRAKGRAALLSLDAAQQALEDGRAFAMHPEGTRSPDGRLYRGRTGVARLSLVTGAPVLPCGIVGSDRLLAPGSRLPRPAKVVVTFGPLLRPGQYRSGPMAVRSRDMTIDIMTAIQRLTGQEYVDRFSPGPHGTTG
ncbi:lysophospholipid acyltransferase family protein [Cumulibacter manganitolerans]|uniref:lysophospholipid acyltransferase family protein n=1 Tax=Cumulibacter manganitolerans TaxID=1884992 RepID=UPI001294A9CF|nr:lysophospholipid acyltransferase family protein [Cumulibacter manganitolerans]